MYLCYELNWRALEWFQMSIFTILNHSKYSAYKNNHCYCKWPQTKISVKTRKLQRTITFWTETNRKQEENKICRSIIFIFKFSLMLAHFFSILFDYCFVFILCLISNFSLMQNVVRQKLAALTHLKILLIHILLLFLLLVLRHVYFLA